MAHEKRQNGNGVDATTNIDIDALVGSMKRMMMPSPRNMSSKTCIFKTPEILFRNNNKAYLPVAFSIGPFHHGKPHLQGRERIKLHYLHGLLCRSFFCLRDEVIPEGSSRAETNLRHLIKEVAALEGEARICYDENVNFRREEFTRMLLLDGCFLVELFRKRRGVVRTEEGDPVLKVPSMLQCLSHDLVLLENQIPWFVLQRLYSITNDVDEYDDSSLIKMVNNFFQDTFSIGRIPTVKPTPPCGHILYLLRETLILSSTQVDFRTGADSVHFDALSFPSATSLVEAGVKFRKLCRGEGGSSSSILDVKFDKHKGVLEISPFLIHDTTEATFRNLISFEQCYPECKPAVTSYLRLMDDLIDTSKDLNILRDKGIVPNCWLDAEEATRIFNGIYSDTFVDKFYYTGLCREVNAYCKRKWPRWRAMYMRNYFGTPWAIASQVLAALLLIFAFLQTLFTIIN